MLRAVTCFHADHARLKVGEIFEEVRSLERFVDDLSAVRRNVVDLEDDLANVDSHRDGIHSCHRSEVPQAHDALSAQRRSPHRITSTVRMHHLAQKADSVALNVK